MRVLFTFPLLSCILKTMTKRSFKHGFGAVVCALWVLSDTVAHADLAKATVLETDVAYLRVAQIKNGLPEEISAALTALQASNRITGAVLDLRFAAGNNFDTLQPAEQALVQSKLPLAILINSQTSGAADRLADDLRQSKTGLIFGSQTRDLEPDISVPVPVAAERLFLEDPYVVLTQADTNSTATTNFLPFVDHTTEADLVREKIKDGDELPAPDQEPVQEQAPLQPQTSFIRDPVLARGVDFIKGLTALHLSRK